jgi:hypothetical protein
MGAATQPSGRAPASIPTCSILLTSVQSFTGHRLVSCSSRRGSRVWRDGKAIVNYPVADEGDTRAQAGESRPPPSRDYGLSGARFLCSIS